MSQGPGQPGPDPTGAVGGAGGQQPSEEQIRAYLAQLRQAAPDEIVAQAFSVLASGAEVKLGRQDARLLIDAASALAEAVEERVEADLERQMTNALNQLRVAQVDAEKQLAKLRDEGKLPAEEEGELPDDAGEVEVSEEVAAAAAEAQRASQQPGSGRPDAPGRQPSDSDDVGSRLWVPGR